MTRVLALALGCLTLLAPSLAWATANYVYHEQTTNPLGGTCGNYVTNLTPTPAQTYPLAFKIEYQFYTDNAVVYYTTDGTPPSGAYGVVAGTTQVLSGAYACQFLDPLGSGMYDDAVDAVIPAQPAGTTVHYIVSAWHSPLFTGGPEVFANSGTCGTCTPCELSSCATVFSYTVASPSDASADGGPADGGTDASPEAALDVVTPDVVGPDVIADVGAPDVLVDAAPSDSPLDAGGDSKADGASGPDAPIDAATDVGPDTAEDVTPPADAPVPDSPSDAHQPGREASSGRDSGRHPADASGFDARGDAGEEAGTSNGGGCGCSVPGEPSSLAWLSASAGGLLFAAALARGKRKKRP